MEILRTSGLSKSYEKIRALDQLELVVNKGEVMGLLGPNGSGKTTTLGIILDILIPTSGTFEWFEGQYGDNPRKHIGSILETPNFYPYLNAYENLEIVRQIKKVDDKNFDDLLKKVNLYERRFSSFKTYSLGMKQRLAIAATLIGNPDVLIFDEPTNGLDPKGISEVREILQGFANEGKTVIMASHILAEVEKICSHVAIIRKGKLLASGAVGSVIKDDLILELSSENLDTLRNFLGTIPQIKSITDKGVFLECEASSDLDAYTINKLAWKADINLGHIVVRKSSLEEEFLQVTKEYDDV